METANICGCFLILMGLHGVEFQVAKRVKLGKDRLKDFKMYSINSRDELNYL